MTKEQAYDVLMSRINDLHLWGLEGKIAEKTLGYILGVVDTLETLLDEGKDNADM